MSTLDKAFIKAFSKDSGLSPSPTARTGRPLRRPVKPVVTRQAAPATPDDPYLEGTWYRIDDAETAAHSGEDSAAAEAAAQQRPGRNARRPHVRFREAPPQPASVQRPAAARMKSSRPAPPVDDIPAPALEQDSTSEAMEIPHAAMGTVYSVAVAGPWDSHDIVPAPLEAILPELAATPDPVVVRDFVPEPAPPTVRVDPPAASAVAKPHFPIPEEVTENAETASTPSPELAKTDGKPIVEPAPTVAAAESKSETKEAVKTEATTAAASGPVETEGEATLSDAIEFQPAWEVERFSWPTACDELLASAFDDWGLAVRQLLASAKRGCKTLAVAGVRRGEGRSTLALCMARLAAQFGGRVALIDADFENPQLANMLGVGTECDWKLALADGQSLAEASIFCLADALTLLPLQQPVPFKQVSFRQPAICGMLKTAAHAFDLVLVDVGPIAAPEFSAVWGGKSCPFDGALLVRDLRRTDAEEMAATAAGLRKHGIEHAIVLENFSATESVAGATTF